MATRTEFAIPLFIALAAMYIVLPCLALIVNISYRREEKRLQMAVRAGAARQRQEQDWSASIELDIIARPLSPTVQSAVQPTVQSTVQPTRSTSQRTGKVLPLIWRDAEGRFLLPSTASSNRQRAQTDVGHAQTNGQPSSSVVAKTRHSRKGKERAPAGLETNPFAPQPVRERKQKLNNLRVVPESKASFGEEPSSVQSQRAHVEQVTSPVNSVNSVNFKLGIVDPELEPWPEVPKEWFEFDGKDTSSSALKRKLKSRRH
jgi:hypothetical protein